VSVRESLLSLLRDGPDYGFSLKTRFEQATGDVWPLNVGQVYTTLDRLERDGLVEVDETGEQKLYALTPAGSDQVAAWFGAQPADHAPPRDDMLIKLLVALTFGRDHALDVLSKQRSALVDGMRSRRRAAADDSEVFAARLVADAVLLRTEADVRWLDRCEERILAASPAELTGAAPTDATEPGEDTPSPRRTRAARTRRTRR